MYAVQAEDLEILRQSNREVYARIELLDAHFKAVSELAGEVISDSYSVDSQSIVRRTYSLDICITENSVVAQQYSVWIDKYIRLTIGLKHNRSGETRWYPAGIFLCSAGSYHYDAVSKTLSLSCLDLMCRHTGERGGQQSGAGTLIEAESDARTSLVQFLTQVCGVSKYMIRDLVGTIPYDFEFPMGSYMTDVLSEYTQIDVGFEFFYDEDVFIFRKRPTATADPIAVDAATIEPLIIDISRSVAYTDVYNVTEVWGAAVNDSDVYAASAIVKLVSSAPDVGTIAQDKAREPTQNIIYVVDAQSPYTVEKIGEVRQVLSGGEYTNIQTDELAADRAKYENWLSTDLLDEVQVTMMDIPWLDVHQKIEIPIDGETGVYMVKSKSGSSTEGQMSLTCVRFQPVYSWL